MNDLNGTKKGINETCKRFGVEMLFVFGSRAKEVHGLVEEGRSLDRTVASDVDIGIKTSRPTSLSVKQKVQLSVVLEDLLGVNRVDLCLLDEVDPFVAANIVRGERLYCDDPYHADEYELFVLRRAGDLVFLERERLRLIFDEPRGD